MLWRERVQPLNQSRNRHRVDKVTAFKLKNMFSSFGNNLSNMIAISFDLDDFRVKMHR